MVDMYFILFIFFRLVIIIIMKRVLIPVKKQIDLSTEQPSTSSSSLMSTCASPITSTSTIDTLDTSDSDLSDNGLEEPLQKKNAKLTSIIRLGSNIMILKIGLRKVLRVTLILNVKFATKILLVVLRQ